jgi:diguanylate cyclase (GGDEF)-like protein
MTSTPPSAIDRLDQLRKPLVLRAIALVLCFCVLLLAFHVSSQVASYQGQLDDSATSTANMARALASHAERSIKIADAILGEMVERAEYEQLDNKETGRVHARLQAIVAATPEIQELFIYASDGTRVATSLPTMLGGSNADREYFRYHMQHADRQIHLGMPIRSRSTGVLAIPLSRRVNRPDGSFGGVVMASLRLDFFGRFYDSFDVGKTGTIVLAVDNGTLLYRRPFNPALVGADIKGTAIYRLYQQSGQAGTAMRVAKIDGIERMYSFRHLDGFPLLVAIAQSKHEILDKWWSSFFKTSGVVLAAIAFLAWGAQRMIRQLMVREALEDALREARAVTELRNVALQALANTDSLTGLANRRHFERVLATEQERARRTGKPCSIILGDIDYFKKYNDHYGHVAGDSCLQQVAGAITRGLRRPADLAARYGGEEFVVILPETDLEGACAVAQSMRAGIAALSIAHAGSPFGHVTISLGVYTGHAGADTAAPENWVKSADALLYEAKAAGRDRVAAGEEGPDGLDAAHRQTPSG